MSSAPRLLPPELERGHTARPTGHAERVWRGPSAALPGPSPFPRMRRDYGLREMLPGQEPYAYEVTPLRLVLA